jgi:hypothetical protein
VEQRRIETHQFRIGLPRTTKIGSPVAISRPQNSSNKSTRGFEAALMNSAK